MIALDEKELFKNDPAAQWLNRPQPARPMRQQHHKPKIRKGSSLNRSRSDRSARDARARFGQSPLNEHRSNPGLAGRAV
jgi:hypothetical protein